ncbi:DUF2273 domain-containing protein [Lihuaxuella thermophila]|uniref:Uncharacterized membrane protein n=1 Tax=Lihuaxuella thermophila TaxID=1173111 RepID=A0A1H8ET53_9BACL|nr:DUF2273 domain-containing protein [Lihuaxuella thermophila]SEN22556.1 Uncharacterized membrane protein [Lihuaxuella thermophila]
MDRKLFESIWLQYGGRILGTLIGFVLGLIYLFAGFWKTLFFAILVGLGFFIGKQLDHKEDFKQIIDLILLDKWMNK